MFVAPYLFLPTTFGVAFLFGMGLAIFGCEFILEYATVRHYEENRIYPNNHY